MLSNVRSFTNAKEFSFWIRILNVTCRSNIKQQEKIPCFSLSLTLLPPKHGVAVGGSPNIHPVKLRHVGFGGGAGHLLRGEA